MREISAFWPQKFCTDDVKILLIFKQKYSLENACFLLDSVPCTCVKNS